MMKNQRLKLKIIKKFISFSKNTNGNIAIMMSLLLIPLAAFIGGALDFSQKVSYTNRLQATLDNVSIAVAKELAQNLNAKDSDLKKIGDIIYKTNHKLPSNITNTPYTIVRSGGLLTVAQTAQMDTTFMRLVGTSTLPISVSSTVNLERSDVELVMILDTTGSMRGSKLKDLKTASKSLINTLIQDTSGLSSMRIGFVPWSVGVNVSSTKTEVIEDNIKGKHYCAGSRSEAKDESPISSKLPFAYVEVKYRNKKVKVDTCSNREVVSLTDNKTTLLKEVDLWQANSQTSSDTGLTWGWGVLSPNWSDYWPAKNLAKSYNSDVKKFAVLMTDGQNTVGHVDANGRSKKLCTAMKAKGIKIYSIGFKVNSTNAINLLKNCATQLDMYIDASSGTALKNAFQRIAEEVGSFYISK